MQQAAYAMVYTKFKEGVSHTTAAIQAERRHQLAQAVDAELEQAITPPTSTPTLEAWMVIPAQQAPRSLTEVRGANVTLTGSSSISLERGRETVREGDEVRGREFERHLDPVLVEATTGRVTLDAPHTVLADARPSGTQGVAITGTVVDASRPLAHHEWDHTEALRRQQEEAAMRSSMGGGMGGMGMGGMFPETSAVSFSFGAGGTSVSGFTPSSGGDWQSIEHPGRREMMRQTEMARQYPFMSRHERERAQLLGTPGFDPMAEFERMMSVAKPQDTYRRIVPNGIIERMETHAFHMQQEHAWEQFRQELEELTVAAYEDEEDTRAATAELDAPVTDSKAEADDVAKPRRTIKAEDKAAIKTVGNAMHNLNKALHEHERLHGDKTTLVEGVWVEELARTQRALQSVQDDLTVSEKIKGYAQLCWRGIQFAFNEVTSDPEYAHLIPEIFVPLYDGARKQDQAMRGGEGADQLTEDAQLSMLIDSALIGCAGQYGYAAGVVLKAGIKGNKVIGAVGKFLGVFQKEMKGALKRNLPGFNTIESKIVREAKAIFNSDALSLIKDAHKTGKSVTVNINGRIIQYEPSLPASGMTMFGENGFLIGSEAFTSNAELGKTILHELHRLNTSASATGVSAILAKNETKAAADFAEKAIMELNK